MQSGSAVPARATSLSGNLRANRLLVTPSQPMFYAALAFAGGIACNRYAWRPSAWWVFATLAFTMAALYLRRGRPGIAYATALAAIVACGALAAQLESDSGERAPDLSVYEGQQVVVTGHVLRTGLPRSTQIGQQREQRQVVDIQTDSLELDGRVSAITAGLRVSFFNKLSEEDQDAEELAPASSAFTYGQRVRFRAHLRLPRNYLDPGAMDYQAYLAGLGIEALGSAKVADVELLPGRAGSAFAAWRYRMRTSLTQKMLAFADVSRNAPAWLRIDGESAGLLTAMIIGEQSLLERDIKADFQRTGTFHIIVVSGMNVAILAGVLFWLARIFRFGEITATFLTVILSLSYAYVTDLGAPVLRAAIMLSLFLVARLLYRERFSLNSIGTAALVLLIVVPQSLFDASFQLTFLSVVVLGGITQPLAERTSMKIRKALYRLDNLTLDPALPPRLAQFRLELRMLLSALLRAVRAPAASWPGRLAARSAIAFLLLTLSLFELVLVTSIMQMALALPMAVYFHRLALLGLPANLVVVPLTAALMPVALAATLLSYGSLAAAKLPVLLTGGVLNAIVFTVKHLGGLRFAEVRLAYPLMPISLLSVAAFVVCMLLMRRHRAWASAGLVGLVLAAFLLTVSRAPAIERGKLEITAIDVGQGDSILVVSPQGATLLIDGGGPPGFVHANGFDVGEDVVSPYLWSRGFTRLDAVALTHAHSDHLGGLHAIISNFRPKEVWIGSEADTAGFHQLMQEAERFGAKVILRRSNESFDFNGARVRVIAPASQMRAAATNAKRAQNNVSLVLEVAYKDQSALLLGDAERLEESMIVPALHQETLIKVAHHGSATSTTPELLAATRPEYALVSVGYHNLYHHPKPEVLARLYASGARVYRTDMFGASTFYLDGNRVVARAATAP